MRNNVLKTPPNEHDHRIGSLKAPVVLVEYGCYECIRCARANVWLKEMVKEFGDDLCYIFRHFPITDVHPNAALAAMASEAAALKNKFWEMHNILYDNTRILSGESIINLATGLGIDEDGFMLDLNRTDLMDAICKDIVGGEDSGVTDAYTFFLNNKRIEGKVDEEMLRKKIHEILDNRDIRQASSF